jgi:hypothetical protein
LGTTGFIREQIYSQKEKDHENWLIIFLDDFDDDDPYFTQKYKGYQTCLIEVLLENKFIEQLVSYDNIEEKERTQIETEKLPVLFPVKKE